MHTTMEAPRTLEDVRTPVGVKLAGLWASLMLVYAYVDILGFYKPGSIEEILAGVVWEFDISQGWAVGALTLMIVPILMIVGSLTLPARVNRIANLVVASLYIVVSVGNAIGEAWVYYYGLAALVEAALLALVIRYAWSWPRTQPHPVP